MRCKSLVGVERVTEASVVELLEKIALTFYGNGISSVQGGRLTRQQCSLYLSLSLCLCINLLFLHHHRKHLLFLSFPLLHLYLFPCTILRYQREREYKSHGFLSLLVVCSLEVVALYVNRFSAKGPRETLVIDVHLYLPCLTTTEIERPNNSQAQLISTFDHGRDRSKVVSFKLVIQHGREQFVVKRTGGICLSWRKWTQLMKFFRLNSLYSLYKILSISYCIVPLQRFIRRLINLLHVHSSIWTHAYILYIFM